MKYIKFLKFGSTLFFFLFIFIYVVGSSGLYEYKLNEKKVLTEQQIKNFENDVNNGVKIDITDYIVPEKNYDNVFTKTNRKISQYISKGFEESFKYLFRYINNSV